MNKIFETYNEFEKYFFPRTHEERKKKERIKKIGFPEYLIKEFLNGIKRGLNNES